MHNSKLVLRPVQLSDASLMLEWENNNANWSVSDTITKYTQGEIINLINDLEDIDQAKQARFIIVDKTSNVSLGAVDLFGIDFDEELASVGILVANEGRRREGVASQSLLLLEELCLEELGISNLQATVHVSNIPSVKLFEKLGFSKKKLTQLAESNNADYIETLIFKKCLKK